jgi:hypothetical protein
MTLSENHKDGIHNPKTLRKIVIGSGFLMWGLSVLATIQFWKSLGDSLSSSGVYILAGLVISFIALIMLPLTVHSWRKNQIVLAVISAIIWCVLVSLMLIAEFGFFAKPQVCCHGIKPIRRMLETPPLLTRLSPASDEPSLILVTILASMRKAKILHQLSYPHPCRHSTIFLIKQYIVHMFCATLKSLLIFLGLIIFFPVILETQNELPCILVGL